jgi:hypothetical protein
VLKEACIIQKEGLKNGEKKNGVIHQAMLIPSLLNKEIQKSEQEENEKNFLLGSKAPSFLWSLKNKKKQR